MTLELLGREMELRPPLLPREGGAEILPEGEGAGAKRLLEELREDVGRAIEGGAAKRGVAGTGPLTTGEPRNCVEPLELPRTKLLLP